MDDLFSILAKFVPVILAILYFIGSRKGEPEEKELDPEAAERTRRIQEEIRRKILERQLGGVPSERKETRVPQDGSNIEWEDEEVEAPVREVVVSTPKPAPVRPRMEPVKRAPVLEYTDPALAIERRKQEIEEQMRKARELREKTSLGLGAVTVGTRKRVPAGAPVDQSDLRGQLMNRGSLRRAFVMKEVLDKPLGLR